jgi:hypothetical protein
MNTQATTAPPPEEYAPRGAGSVVFAGTMLAIGGILNVIYGIAAISDSKFFVSDTQFIFSNLNTWGWITLLLGGVQLLAAGSLSRGGQFGRWFGIAAASGSAIAALLSLPAYPFWSLAIFAIDMIIIHGLAVNFREYRSAVRG